jgi:hypothetical protein
LQFLYGSAESSAAWREAWKLTVLLAQLLEKLYAVAGDGRHTFDRSIELR